MSPNGPASGGARCRIVDYYSLRRRNRDVHSNAAPNTCMLVPRAHGCGLKAQTQTCPFSLHPEQGNLLPPTSCLLLQRFRTILESPVNGFYVLDQRIQGIKGLRLGLLNCCRTLRTCTFPFEPAYGSSNSFPALSAWLAASKASLNSLVTCSNLRADMASAEVIGDRQAAFGDTLMSFTPTLPWSLFFFAQADGRLDRAGQSPQHAEPPRFQRIHERRGVRLVALVRPFMDKLRRKSC